jgi:hypothetical protein
MMTPENVKAEKRAQKLHNWLKLNKANAPRPPKSGWLALHLCFEDLYQLENGKVVVLVKLGQISPAEVRWLLKGCKQLGYKAKW